MHKKKIQALMVAGLLSVGVIGGTLAWFTSQDDITNVFKTGSVDDTNDGVDAGIDLNENFLHPGEDGRIDVKYDNENDKWTYGSTEVVYDKEEKRWEYTNGEKICIDDVLVMEKTDENGKVVEMTKPVTPNTKLLKEVEIENTSNYSQLVKAKVIKYFVDPNNGYSEVTHYKQEGTTVTYAYYEPWKAVPEGWEPLKLEYIVLADNLYAVDNKTPQDWIIQENATANTAGQTETNTYYYKYVLEPGKSTTDLLKNVTLHKDANDVYKNLRFDVRVEAESIQATNNAVGDLWKDAPEDIKELDKSYR